MFTLKNRVQRRENGLNEVNPCAGRQTSRILYVAAASTQFPKMNTCEDCGSYWGMLGARLEEAMCLRPRRCICRVVYQRPDGFPAAVPKSND